MTPIWLALALMTGAACMAVLWPLSRRALADAGATAETETRFYRDQIAEIGRDVARGLLAEPEAEAAKAEAARRLLRATRAAEGKGGGAEGEPALRRRRAAAAFALSTVPLVALGAYGFYGSPDMPGQPLAERRAAANTPGGSTDLGAAVARIEEHLAREPGDGRGWEVLAPVYLRAGRPEDAAHAYQMAIRALGEAPGRLADYGEALVAAKAGVITAEARTAFERAAGLDPRAAKPRFYLARAAEQDGDLAGARKLYADLLAEAPPDAPWIALVKARLAQVENPGFAEKPNDPAGNAIASLPAAQRDLAIRGMVEGLEQRLADQGGSPEEWARLVRALSVLGERDRATAAAEKARAALAGREPSSLAAIDEALRTPAMGAGATSARP